MGIMILLSSHKVERIRKITILKPSQQLGAVPGEPRKGKKPVELSRTQSSGDFPMHLS